MVHRALFMIAIVFLFFSKCCISTPVVRARENIPDVPEDVTEDLCALHPELGVPGNIRKSELRQKPWSSGRALGSRSESREFNPRPMLCRWK